MGWISIYEYDLCEKQIQWFLVCFKEWKADVANIFCVLNRSGTNTPSGLLLLLSSTRFLFVDICLLCQPLMQAGSLNDTRFYQIFYERYTSGYGTFHRVYKGVLQQNIARGTTDPGYKVYNLNYLFNFYHDVVQLTLIPNLATNWRHLHWLQIQPPDGAAYIGSRFSQHVVSLVLFSNLTTRWRHLR